MKEVLGSGSETLFTGRGNFWKVTDKYHLTTRDTVIYLLKMVIIESTVYNLNVYRVSYETYYAIYKVFGRSSRKYIHPDYKDKKRLLL